MKAVIALAASLSLANAALLPRQLESIPQCALSCALDSLQSTGCSPTDFACICSATAFVSSLIPCVQSECSPAEIEATVAAASELCAGAGVSLSVPPLGTETTAASSAPAATTEAEATTTEAEATTAPSTEATEAPTTSAEETSAAATTEAPATTAAGNDTTSSTAPPTPTGTEPGAASRNTVALGGLGAIVALVAAFL
ncbi:uncharacterized protein DFL_007790 [Arthrobotrys flagrans]|uniref:CFEM domain-containing protein n=1 Tax=Arthrobotrys flagrans TaxID=97331 RepID=A0A436ZXH5_ARTFL|nr:hypothetical protein DFL_007790 [Arthrobotrys flagrans]